MVAILVLSQQTTPSLQFDVFGIITAGALQNARSTSAKQNPGHLGAWVLIKRHKICVVDNNLVFKI